MQENKNNPLVSVIIPTYKNIEIIVIDKNLI